MKKWNLITPRKKTNKAISEDELIDILLKNRNISDKEKEAYLHPSLDQLSYKAVGLDKKEMEKAFKRLKKAIDTKESMVVYTDYDADGVNGGTIMWETLYKHGANAVPYIPHRIEEGYGLSIKGIDKVKKEHGASLIVTVDHGIVAAEKIAYAKSIGIETIIFDHHILPDTLPDAVAIVHTTKLCAGGISWFFSNYFRNKMSDKDVDILTEDNIELAAIATIADLIPLTGPNRVIAKLGIDQLNHSKRIGINALIEESGLTKGELEVYDVSHVLAPRINAMGRLTHAIDALRLLCTKDKKRAHELASQLSATNRERQTLTQDSTIHATELVQQSFVLAQKNGRQEKLLFISHESYNQGVIGLIAGKLVQTYNLPAIVLSVGAEYAKASARSITGFNIIETIRKASDLLVDAGGHPMAAGFTVATKNIEALRQKLLQIAQDQLTDDMLVKIIKIDAELKLPEITPSLYQTVQRLAPFGVGNTQPIFASLNAEIVKVSTVGKEGRHLKLILRQSDAKYQSVVLETIGFGMGELFHSLSYDMTVDIAYTIDMDNWNNQRRLQLKLVDVKISQSNKGDDGADTPEP